MGDLPQPDQGVLSENFWTENQQQMRRQMANQQIGNNNNQPANINQNNNNDPASNYMVNGSLSLNAENTSNDYLPLQGLNEHDNGNGISSSLMTNWNQQQPQQHQQQLLGSFDPSSSRKRNEEAMSGKYNNNSRDITDDIYKTALDSLKGASDGFHYSKKLKIEKE
jgi:hypothetical protein